MKKKYIFVTGLLCVFSFYAFQTKTVKFEKFEKSKFSNGPLPGKSGAPGENNCTQCHAGQVQDGTGINTMVFTDINTQNIVTEYEPNGEYSVFVNLSTTPIKKGFQTTPRTDNNNDVGTLSVIGNTTTLQNSNGFQYINHNSNSNTTTNGWVFKWTAPATNQGDVTFYLATNETNNNGSNSGDIIRTSTHKISASLVSNTKEIRKEGSFNVSYTYNHAIKLNFTLKETKKCYLNLVDASGKSVYTFDLGNICAGEIEKEIYLPELLKDGIYYVHFFENNTSFAKKLLIHRK